VAVGVPLVLLLPGSTLGLVATTPLLSGQHVGVASGPRVSTKLKAAAAPGNTVPTPELVVVSVNPNGAPVAGATMKLVVAGAAA
jgi:hypothetical protein